MFYSNWEHFYSNLFYLFVEIFCNMNEKGKTSENPSQMSRDKWFFSLYIIIFVVHRYSSDWNELTEKYIQKKYINDIQKHIAQKIGEKWNLWIWKWMDYFVRRFVCWFGCMSRNISLFLYEYSIYVEKNISNIIWKKKQVEICVISHTD